MNGSINSLKYRCPSLIYISEHVCVCMGALHAGVSVFLPLTNEKLQETVKFDIDPQKSAKLYS